MVNRSPDTIFKNPRIISKKTSTGNQTGYITVKETDEPEKGMVSKGMDKLK